VTEQAAQRVLTLPLFAHMTAEQVELVAATLREACA
jgi:dTDP-4-amino-4,6-dideoxygalactose transaminase